MLVYSLGWFLSPKRVAFQVLRLKPLKVGFVIFCHIQVFLLIQSEKIKNDYVYLSWLARCCMY